MSRFSGLPEPENGSRIAPTRAATKAAGSECRRFDELLSKGRSTRSAAHQARSGSYVDDQGARQARTPASTTTIPAHRTTAQPAKNSDEIPIPADVSALGAEAVAAYKRGHARAEVRLAQLSKHPAAAGRSAEVLQLFKQGHSNADIIAHLTKDQRTAEIAVIWDRAIAAVHGGGEPQARSEPETVWDRAYASLSGEC